MATYTSFCLVCGRPYVNYTAHPRYFCSMGCLYDSGAYDAPTDRPATRSRAAKAIRVLRFSCSDCDYEEYMDEVSASAEERSSGQLCPKCKTGTLTRGPHNG
jgi:hypothetical protein